MNIFLQKNTSSSVNTSIVETTIILRGRNGVMFSVSEDEILIDGIVEKELNKNNSTFLNDLMFIKDKKILNVILQMVSHACLF